MMSWVGKCPQMISFEEGSENWKNYWSNFSVIFDTVNQAPSQGFNPQNIHLDLAFKQK